MKTIFTVAIVALTVLVVGTSLLAYYTDALLRRRLTKISDVVAVLVGLLVAVLLLTSCAGTIGQMKAEARLPSRSASGASLDILGIRIFGVEDWCAGEGCAPRVVVQPGGYYGGYGYGGYGYGGGVSMPYWNPVYPPGPARLPGY